MAVFRRKMRNKRIELALIVGSTVTYSLLFLALFPLFGKLTGALTVVPIAVTGWLWGLRGGVLAGILAIPLNVLLAQLVGEFEPQALVRALPAEAAAILTGIATGLARVHFDHLRRHARELRQEHERRETELQKVAKELIEVQERSRETVAMDLHDGLCQLLISAHAFLQSIESSPTADPANRHLTERAIALLQQAIDECRSLMNELYPRALADFGIIAAIRDELREFQELTGCKTSLAVGKDLTLPKDVEMTLYRVFHEALTNVVRHATDVKEVSVQLERAGSNVRLVVQDDGAGFDVESAMQSTRFGGLLIMRRRVEMTGGAFETTSGPGLGTRVAAQIGLNHNGAGAGP